MQVVDFVLDDFCRKSREGLRLLAEEGIHEPDLDLVIPFAGTAAVEGQAAFLGIIRGRGGLYDFRIVHDDGLISLTENDDCLRAPNHIGGKACAGIKLALERISEVSSDLPVVLCRRLCFPLQEKNVSYNIFYHRNPPISKNLALCYNTIILNILNVKIPLHYSIK